MHFAHLQLHLSHLATAVFSVDVIEYNTNSMLLTSTHTRFSNIIPWPTRGSPLHLNHETPLRNSRGHYGCHTRRGMALSSGKVWLLRIVALALSAFSLLSTFDVISKTYLKPEFIYPAIFLLLWLMFELFLSLLTADLKRDRSPVALLPWNEAIQKL